MYKETNVNTCRKCSSPIIKKNGRNRYGNQQYYCKTCHASGVLEPRVLYSQAFKEEVVDTFMENRKTKEAEDIHGIPRKTIHNWVKQMSID